jgi:hypothetical protein
MDWTTLLLDQLEWHWRGQLRPRLHGLTDEEYLWEPAPGAWSVRPRDDGTAAIDFTYPAPDPPPVTTIAWRLAHVIVGVFGARAANHFGGPPHDYATHPYATTAGAALAQLDATHDAWVEGVRGLDQAGLERPCGPAEGPFADRSMAELVLHIHREVIHHGAEVALLRDLYAARA